MELPPPLESSSRDGPPLIGWREYVALPDLKIGAIKAKVDTGACSSSLHAFEMQVYTDQGREYVRFKIHPLQHSGARVIEAVAPVVEFRSVRSSSGIASVRPVIRTAVRLLGQSWPIELTLANRDEMGFRMLLGREAIRGRLLVDCGASFLGGIPKRKGKRQTPPPPEPEAD